MKKALALLFTFAVIITAFAGCKKTDDGKTDDTKKWIIATDTVFKPFEFTDETGTFVGIDVDLLKAIAEDQGFEYELRSLGWDAAVLAVQVGQADGLIAGASITEKRQNEGWIFSDGYYNTTQVFTVKKGSSIKSFADLEGQNVAVKSGTAGMDLAESLKDQYKFTTTVFEDSPTMYQDVILGNSAACVEDAPVMAYSIKTGGLELQLVPDLVSDPQPYGFAIMNTANETLLKLFNDGLKNIMANGKYDQILAKYLEV